MDLNEFRSFISESGVDVWTWIDMAISVASADHQIELRNRRDGIVQKLFSLPFSKCEDCLKNLQIHEDDDDAEQRNVLEIKNLLDDHTQNEKSLIGLLQRLVDMNTTFKTLKETEIGRNVTKLRKHSSNEVRRLVKVLVRKWRDTVDEWVRQNPPIQEKPTDFNGERKSLDEVSIHKGVKSVSCSTSPKRKAEVNPIGLNDQGYEESQHAKKQARPQHVMAIHGIPNNGGSIPIKYW